MEIKLSEIDRARFGIVTAKVSLTAQDKVEDLNDWCMSHDVELLIARCRCENYQIVHSLESSGFYLTDSLVYFRGKKIECTNNPLTERSNWRVATPRDAESVGKVATKAFHRYSSHYHVDPRLNKVDADLVYSSWAQSSCTDSRFCDVVLIICDGYTIIAFLTMKVTSPDCCEILLNGVDPLYQNQGLYFALVSLAKNWATDRGIREMLVSTQITNIAAQKVWCRQGLEPCHSLYTFHKWYDK